MQDNHQQEGEEHQTPQKRGNWAAQIDQNPYYKTNTNQMNPLLQSLSEETDHNANLLLHQDEQHFQNQLLRQSHNPFDLVADFQDQQDNDRYGNAISNSGRGNEDQHSYYLNFADDRSQNPYAHQHSDRNDRQLLGGGQFPMNETLNHNETTYYEEHDGDIREFRTAAQQHPNDGEIEQHLFAGGGGQGLQQTSVFQRLAEESREAESTKNRSQKMKELLKEFGKKKDKVIMEQIMHRASTGMGMNQQNGNASAPHHQKQNSRHLNCDHSNRNSLLLTLEGDDNNKTNYELGEYKRVCTTCKIMKQGLAELAGKEVQTPKSGFGAKIAIAGDKGKSKVTAGNGVNKKIGVVSTPLTNKSNAQQKAGAQRYGETPKANTQAQNPQVNDRQYEELLRLIAQLEAQNTDLKTQLREALYKLSLTSPDDIISQYQNEVLIATQKFTQLSQELSLLENYLSPLDSIQSDLKQVQTKLVDRQAKQKVLEINQKLGGIQSSIFGKIEGLREGYSKEAYQKVCGQNKAKKMMQQEIEEVQNRCLEKMTELKDYYEDQIAQETNNFHKQLEAQASELADKDEQIEELRAARKVLKQELERLEGEQIQTQQELRSLSDKHSSEIRTKSEKEQEKIMSFESKVEQLKKQTEEVEGVKERLEREIRDLHKVIESNNLKQQELNHKLQSDAIKDLEIQIENLKAQLQVKDNELHKLQSQIENLDQKLKVKEKDFKKLEIQIKTSQENLVSAEEQINALTQKEKTLQAQKTQLSQTIEELQNIINDQTQSLQTLQDMLDKKSQTFKLLQQQLEDLEDHNKLLEKQKKKVDIEVGTLKAQKEKIENELKGSKEENVNAIAQKVEAEQQLQDTRFVLQRVQAMLKDKEEFRKLEDIVNQIQSTIVFKSQNHLNQQDKLLVRELFGHNVSDVPVFSPEEHEIREESNRLYFEVRNGYDHQLEVLKKQKDYVKTLIDYSKGLSALDDKALEQNLNCTQLKRNKAPYFIQSGDTLLQEIQAKIDDLETKQAGMDRLSLTKGIEKYDDAFKSRKGSVKSAMASPATFSKKFKTQNQALVEDQDTLNKSTNIPFQLGQSQLRPPVDKRKKRSAMNSSDLGQMFLKDAVADPEFIDELLSNNGGGFQRETQGTIGDWATTTNDPTLKNKHKKLQMQINDILQEDNQTARNTGSGLNRNLSGIVRNSKRKHGNSRQQKLMLGLSTLSARSKINPRMITVENVQESDTRSGINFFQDQEDVQNASFEVKVENEHDIKAELLQFIHCQAMLIEDKQEAFKFVSE